MDEIKMTEYVDRLLKWKDCTDVVKVLIGVRCLDKTLIIDQYVKRLKDDGIDPGDILRINLGMDGLEAKDHNELNSHIHGKIPRDRRTYVFIENIGTVKGWEMTVSSLMADYDADIYISGSDVHFLSTEYSACIAGKYVELKVYPSSFGEFLNRYPVAQEKDRSARFMQYLHTGGMLLTDPDMDDNHNHGMEEGTYYSAVVSGIIPWVKVGKYKALNSVAKYLFENVGNVIKADDIVRETELNKRTVVKYLQALTGAFLFYRADRYDILSKKTLQIHGKYYPVDTGMRLALPPYGGPLNVQKQLENAVFMELLRRGYTVKTGYLRGKEIGFVAEKDGSTEYYCVCLSLLSDSVFEDEIRSLKAVDDNYPKTVLSMDASARNLPDGLIHRNAIEWILDTKH